MARKKKTTIDSIIDLNNLEIETNAKLDKLREDIRRDFLKNLEDSLVEDLQKFGRNASRNGGADIDFNVADTGDFGTGNFGDKIGSTLNKTVSKLIKLGINQAIGGIFGGSTKITSAETSRSKDNTKLNFSQTQQAALATAQLRKGARNT